MNFFKRFFETFKLFWNSVLGQMAADSVVDLINTVGKDYADKLVTEAKNRAERIEKEFPGQPGTVKREQLSNYLVDFATGLGLNIAASLVNLLIELAVNHLKRQGKL